MDPFESTEVPVELGGGAKRPGRSKRLVIAGAAATALAIGMLAAGALSPGVAAAQTTESRDVSTDSDTPKDKGDCPNKDKGSSATSVSV